MATKYENKDVTYHYSKKLVTHDSRYGMTASGANSTVKLFTSSRTLNTDPDWRMKIARQTDATNNYVRKVYTVEAPAIVVATTLTKGAPYPNFPNGYSIVSNLFEQRLDYGNMPAPVVDSALRDIALKRINSRVANDLQQFKALVPLGEIRELRGLINQLGSMAHKWLLAMRNARKTHGTGVINQLQDTWLAFNFGAAPMIMDTFNILEAINAAANRRNHRMAYTGTARRQYQYNSIGAWQGGAYGHGMRRKSLYTVDLGYKFKAGFSTGFLASNNYRYTDYLGLKPENVIPALWELTAYSWVIDYFTTMGEFLSDTFESTGMIPLYASENHRCIITQYDDYEPRITGNATVLDAWNVSPGVSKMSYFSRTKLAHLPARVLRFKTADEVGANAIVRLLNLASVLKKRVWHY